MTKDELIIQLCDFPGDAKIILQRDPEGNGYSPLYQVYRATCNADMECELDSLGNSIVLVPVN